MSASQANAGFFGERKVTKNTIYIKRDSPIPELVESIESLRKTGSLTIHFSQGGIGQIAWEEKA